MAEGERREVVSAVRNRGALRGPRGCVAADHPLAASAGMEMLRRGGSAIDAAVAAAAVMPVVQPYYSHLGGDLFALTYNAAESRVRALNSSGPAPASATIELYEALGGVPDTGALAVTVPGCVDGWWKLHQAGGRLPWAEVLGPARSYASGGFPASRQLVEMARGANGRVTPGDYFDRVFGRIEEGTMVYQEDLGRTFEILSSEGAGGFYSGEIAARCREVLAAGGAEFSEHDWVGPGRWEQPVAGDFAGYSVHTQPAPSQGFTLPLALRLYEQLRSTDSGLAPAILQHMALAQAFTQRALTAGDIPEFDAQRLVDRAEPGLIASFARPDAPTADGDTTYLLAIDADGNAVSLIQSVFAGWGSGVMVPGTGILMNNRMRGFSLRAGHPNALAPGKRPMHTLHSYMVTGRRGELQVVGGTPGAMQQPQTNLQVLDAILREGADPQDALDAPRWSMGAFAPYDPEYRKVLVEAHTPDTVSAAFRDAGVAVASTAAWTTSMGRAYVATVLPFGGVAAAADIRGEGQAIVF